MSNVKRLTFKEISKLLRGRKGFSVSTASERRNALVAAAAIDVDIITTATDKGFKIIYK